MRYRTADDVRAIPNLQWAEWLRAGTLPFQEFSSERDCQTVLRHLIVAHGRRLGLKIPRAKPRPKSDLNEKMAEAYWRHVAAVQAERRKGLDD